MATKARILVVQGGGRGAYEKDRPLAEFVQSLMPDRDAVAYSRLEGLELEWTDWQLIRSDLEGALANLCENGQIIAHSLGGAALLKFLSEGSAAPPINGLFLVAVPYMCEDGDWSSIDFSVEDDFAARLPDCGDIWLYHSREDDIVPCHHVELYAAKLPLASVNILDGYGHQFTSKPFNELADGMMQYARDLQ